jgi:hypothetical protein
MDRSARVSTVEIKRDDSVASRRFASRVEFELSTALLEPQQQQQQHGEGEKKVCCEIMLVTETFTQNAESRRHCQEQTSEFGGTMVQLNLSCLLPSELRVESGR